MPKNSRKHRSEDDDSDDLDLTLRTPIKKKKEVSFNETDDEDDEPMEQVDTGIPPNEMLKHVQGFLEYVESTGKSDSLYKTAVGRLADEYFGSSGEDRSFDMDTFVKTLKKYLVLSFKRINVDTSLRCVKDYLESPDSVVHYEGYPRNPPSLLTYYGRKNNLHLGFGKTADVKAKMLADEAGKMECEHELSKLEAKYLKDLESFRNNYKSELTLKQNDFLDKKIKGYIRKIHGPVIKATPKVSRGQSKAKKTAFDLFCATKKDKYIDLDEETRLKKLRKKFEKLEEDKKEIFEKLAMA